MHILPESYGADWIEYDDICHNFVKELFHDNRVCLKGFTADGPGLYQNRWGNSIVWHDLGRIQYIDSTIQFSA